MLYIWYILNLEDLNYIKVIIDDKLKIFETFDC